MNYLWSLFVAGLFFIMIMSHVHGMYPSQLFSGDSVLEALNKELIETVIKPNRGKYTFYEAPQMSERGLTHCLEVWVILTDVRCSSFEQAELIHRQIYKDLFFAANSIRIIRPFLAEFPLTPNSFYLHVSFLDSQGERLRPPNFSAIISRESSIRFHNYATDEEFSGKDPSSGPGYKIIKKIQIFDATWLKEYFSVGAPRKKENFHTIIPKYSRPPSLCSDSGKAIFWFEKKFCETNGLSLVTIGNASESSLGSKAFDFVLRGEQPLDLDQSRKLVSLCFNETLKFIRNDQDCLDYMKRRSNWSNLKDPATVPEPRHIAFRISFWDENIDRQPEPYIAEIRVVGDNCKYFTANEKQQLVLAFEETLKDPSIVNDGSKIDEAVIQPG